MSLKYYWKLAIQRNKGSSKWAQELKKKKDS